MIGDSWQWIPFIFIVLLAAFESQPRDEVEAAELDGAIGWQIFRDITWPSIAPVAATVVLIRLIEAFKIVDLPNVLTNGGPGIATESLTLHAFIAWRALDLGASAAVAYMLLFVSTIVCVSFFNFVVRAGARGGRAAMTRLFESRTASASMAPATRLLGLRLPSLWTLSSCCSRSTGSLITSFKLPIDVDNGPFYLPFIDFQPSLHAWQYIFVDVAHDTLRPYLNSVIVAHRLSTCLAIADRLAWPPMRWSASASGRARLAIVLLHPLLVAVIVAVAGSSASTGGSRSRSRSRCSCSRCARCRRALHDAAGQ